MVCCGCCCWSILRAPLGGVEIFREGCAVSSDPKKPSSPAGRIAATIFLLAAIATIVGTINAFVSGSSVDNPRRVTGSSESESGETKVRPTTPVVNSAEATLVEQGEERLGGLNGFDVTIGAGANMEDVGPGELEISRWIGHRSDISVEWEGVDNEGMPSDPGDCAIVVEMRLEGELLGRERSGDCAGSVDFMSIDQDGVYEIAVSDGTSGVSATETVTVFQPPEKK